MSSGFTKVNWNLPVPIFERFKREVARRMDARGKVTSYGINAEVAQRALEIGLDKLEKEKL